MKKILAVLGMAVLVSASFAQVTVFSTNAGGDFYSDPTPSNPGGTVAINSYIGPNGAQWFYNEMKDSAVIGINGTQARSGNGSVQLNSIGTATNPNSKASITYARSDLGALGNVADLTHWGADLRTEATPLSNANFIMRLYVGDGTNAINGNRQGFLVWDTQWNPGFSHPAITYGQWQTFDLMSIASSLWVRPTNSLITTLQPNLTSGEILLSDALSILGGLNYKVFSANAGWGTSNTPYEGYMDNYTLGFNGVGTTHNFEVVPEPATMSLLALAALRRRKKATVKK